MWDPGEYQKGRNPGEYGKGGIRVSTKKVGLGGVPEKGLGEYRKGRIQESTRNVGYR